MKPQSKYKVIGLMSGTSLDGLDLVFCELTVVGKKWGFKIRFNETIKYSPDWNAQLSSAHQLSSPELLALDQAYGKYLGACCLNFIKTNGIKKVDLIASHGHTIFHQPERGFTFQLGNGNALHAVTRLPVVFDFRSLDVTLGGQGAPLVPVGDRYLFSQYDVCLNLGGIGNLSHEQKGKRIAYDFCFANMGLNYLASQTGLSFDRDGEIAARGKVNDSLLGQINSVYSKWQKTRPSLGREGFEANFLPILNQESFSGPDKMRTFCESIAIEIEKVLPSQKKKMKLLITGGGALNTFLVELIKRRVVARADVILPDRTIIEFKEAVVFALLGVLRSRNEVNCLKSVTGAKQDSSGGILVGS